MLFGENYWGRLRSSWGSKDEQEFAREQNPAGQMSRVHHWAVATQGTVKSSERPGQGKDALFNSDVGDRLATGTKGFSTS